MRFSRLAYYEAVFEASSDGASADPRERDMIASDATAGDATGGDAAASEESLNTPEIRRLLRTLGQKPSRSAEDARERQLEELRALTVEERMALALRLGRRDRAILGGRR